MLPAPGQGTLAVECRSNDKLMRPALEQMDDPVVRAAFEAERSFMISLGGDCAAALAALAEARDGTIRLRGLVAMPDGSTIIQDQLEGEDPEKTGIELADRLRERGADEILAAARG
jgi:hydroxymethylbilane synthase